MKINTDRNEVEKSVYVIILHLCPLIISPIACYFLSKNYVLDIDIAINITLLLSYGTFAIIALSPIVYFQMLEFSTVFYNRIIGISELLAKERENLNKSETDFTKIMDNLKELINDELATPSIKIMLEDQIKTCTDQIEHINNRKIMNANMSGYKLVEALDILLIKVYGSFKFIFLKAVVIFVLQLLILAGIKYVSSTIIFCGIVFSSLSFVLWLCYEIVQATKRVFDSYRTFNKTASYQNE
jgi:hypothetical protein